MHPEYVGSVETAQVKAGEAGASPEHATHVSYIGGIEVAKIKAC